MLPLDYSLRKESNAIGTTLDSLGIHEQIILIGWSFGGLIAMDFALNNPSRIKKLVLYEPPAFWVAIAKGESPKGMEQMIRLTRAFKLQASITEAQLAEFRCILNSCDTSAIRIHPQWHIWAKQKERLRGLSVVADHTDSLERLRSFEKPVLILTGQGTIEFHSRINELLEMEFPNSTLKEIAGGHFAPQDAVDEFIQAVVQFITK